MMHGDGVVDEYEMNQNQMNQMKTSDRGLCHHRHKELGELSLLGKMN